MKKSIQDPWISEDIQRDLDGDALRYLFGNIVTGSVAAAAVLGMTFGAAHVIQSNARADVGAGPKTEFNLVCRPDKGSTKDAKAAVDILIKGPDGKPVPLATSACSFRPR